jgi:NAD-dependent SIR2 family protein deacetylase
LIEQITNLKVTEPLTRETLIANLKGKKFNRVVFLTGAAISIAAGVPDFRSGQYI